MEEKMTNDAYYNEAQDINDQQRYYASIQSGSSLFNDLHQLLSNTHSKQLDYAPTRHLYPLVDLHPDDLIHSIYSGKEFTAQELIALDKQVDLQRQNEMARLTQLESQMTQERFEMVLDDLESAMPYNCEHVVPQSWFGKQSPMRGDLHHLFACESGCNSFRGNLPYHDFEDYEPVPVVELAPLRKLCGKSENNLFEPENNKGIVARAVLYFLVRYPGQLSGHYSNNENLEMLLNWHSSQEVTVFERHRNQCIYKAQGNRNPFVDKPAWAREVVGEGSMQR
jgi:endonuclease G, mitochondrial